MRIAMVLVDGFFDSGVACVLDVLSTAGSLAGAPLPPGADGSVAAGRARTSEQGASASAPSFDVELRGPGTGATSRHGLRAGTTPWAGLADDPPDVVVLPAFGLRTAAEVVELVTDHPVVDLVRELAGRGVQLAAACSGAFLLAEAGLLDGRVATTSWWLAAAFRARYPQVDLRDGSTLVVDADVTTAGAAFSHVDLGLSLVNRRSPTLADEVGRYLVVGDRPAQSSAAIPAVLVGSNPTLVAFEHHVRENIAASMTIGAIARAIGTSERTLQRVTAEVLGVSPLRFVQQVRADHARHLLRTTDMSTRRVAEAVGYAHASSLRALLRRLSPDDGDVA